MLECWKYYFVTALLLRGGATNPVDTFRSQLQTAECNGEPVEITISLEDEVNFSTSYLLSEAGDLPQNCNVSWRIALQRIDSLENWGIEVDGSVDIQDSNNDYECLSSSLTITDQDIEGDVSAITHNECGTKDVKFLTYEDSVTIIMTLAEAQGTGFDLTVKPILACGGKIEGSKGDKRVISTPAFPKPYPTELACTWDVVVSDNSTMHLQCNNNKFILLPKIRGRCIEYLMVQSGGEMKKYCGKALNGKKKALRWPDLQRMALFFRSGSRPNKFLGFECELRFE